MIVSRACRIVEGETKMELREIDRLIYDLARPHLNTRQNDVHTEIALRFALRLLESEPGDPAVVIPAIILHDVGWIKVPEDLQLKAFGPKDFDENLRRVHEVEGTRLALEILEQVGYDPALTNEIGQIIEGHDSRLTALSESDKLVKDADKLFRYDPVGLRIDAERFGVEIRTHCDWLRQKITPWFFTATAKQLAGVELGKTTGGL